MKTDNERILDFADFMLKQLGYVDVTMCEKITGIPKIVIINVLKSNEFKESYYKSQFVKEMK